MKNTTIKQKQDGVTLVETIVAIGIFVIIVVAWNSIIIQSYRSAEFGQQQQEAIREAQKGIEIMTQELREMSTAENGAYALEKADDNEIIFYSDIDKDIYTERVRYWLDGNNLKKGVVEPSGDPLDYNPSNEQTKIITNFVNNSTSSLFTYFNEDYPYDEVNNPLPAPARLIDTKLIHIFLRVNIDPSKAPKDFDVEADVQLRNLKTNL